MFTLLSAAAVSFLVHCQMEKGEELLGSVVTHPQSIAIDSSSEMMFVVDQQDNKIFRANLETGEVADLNFAGLVEPHSVAVDEVEGKLYWTDTGIGKVQRCLYNGFDLEDVVVGLDSPAGVAVVSAGADGSTVQVLWATTGAIQTARVPPASISANPYVTDISAVSSSDGVFGMAVDSDYVYWTSPTSGKIQRAPLDGSGSAQAIVEGLDQPQDVAVNAAEDMVYWSDPGTGRIGRASIDTSIAGANPESVVVSSGEPRGLAFDGDTRLYYGDSSKGAVLRSGVDGECFLYRGLGDENIALIILGGGLGVAVIGCCAVGGWWARRRRASKNSPPDPSKTGVVPSLEAGGEAERAKKAAPDDEGDKEEADKKKAAMAEAEEVKQPPLTEKVQEALAIKRDEENLKETDLAMEPEIDNARRGGQCCLFCTAG